MTGPLAHVRVVDLSDLRGAMCGRILADLGADVIHVRAPGLRVPRVPTSARGAAAHADSEPGTDVGRDTPAQVSGSTAAHADSGPGTDVGGDTPAQVGGGAPVGIAYRYRHANKRGAVLDPTTANGRRRLDVLLADADVLVDNLGAAGQVAARLTPHEVAAAHPHLVHVALTDLGLSGPRSGWRLEPLPALAASGALHHSGFPDRPPCWLPGHVAHDCASVYGALGAVAALLDRRRHGRGQLVEISTQEAALAGMTPWSIALADYARVNPLLPVAATRNADGSYWVLPAKDGWVRLVIGTQRQWGGFVALAGSPEALTGDEWLQPGFRSQNADVVRLVAADLLADRTRAELFDQAQGLGATLGMVHSPSEFVAHEQTRARRFFAASGFPGLGDAPFATHPARLSATPTSLRGPAPLPVENGDGETDGGEGGKDREGGGAQASWSADGAAAGWSAPAPPNSRTGPRMGPGQAPRTEPGQAPPTEPGEGPRTERREEAAGETRPPLEGLLVIEFGMAAVIPELCGVLSELGADVVKIESLAHPDVLRFTGLGHLNRGFAFNAECRGRRSVALDLSTEDGRRLARALVAKADVVAENFRGGALERIGLGYDAVRADNPRVVYVSSQGYGRGGPYGEMPAYGPLNSCFAGIHLLWNHPDSPYPCGTSLNHPDHVAGKLGAVSVLAALGHREATGEGQLIDLAQTEAGAYLLGEVYLAAALTGREPRAAGNTHHAAVPHGVYPAAGEDRWIAVAVHDDDAWRRLADGLGWAADPALDTLAGRLAARDAVDERLAAWTSTVEAAEAAALLQRHGVSAMPVMGPDDHHADPHLAERGFIAHLVHPEVGPERHVGNPMRFSRLPARIPASAPCLGADTDEVLTGLLGLSADEVATLRAAGVCR